MSAVPEITQSDLAAFHAAHFSPAPVAHFSEQFLGPVVEYYEEEVEDDGLGYYEDGVKRTLTDEQIAMFRHSEIQTLLREKRHAEEAKENSPDNSKDKASLSDGDLEDERASDETDVQKAPSAPPKNKQHQNKKKTKKVDQDKSFYKKNAKPDLRKRTWDKVDAGLDGLSYDDEGPTQARSSALQRRRISYDD